MPFDGVFELTGLFLVDVRRQEDSGSSQAVILEVHRIFVKVIEAIFMEVKRQY